MNTNQTVGQHLIHALASYQGWGSIFHRTVAEIQRVNEKMPDATGAEKKAQFLADCKIIGIDVLLPMGGFLLNALIDLGLLYLAAQNPVIGAMAAKVVPGIEAAVMSNIDAKIATVK